MQVTRREFTRLMGVIAGSLAAPVPVVLAGRALESKRPADAKATLAGSDEAQKARDRIWADLVAGNRRFMEGRETPRNVAAVRKVLVNGQHPQVIILTCADSRVSPEIIFDKNLGELFVVRTAGNVADRVALGSLEYAAEHLKAPLLLVMGHEKCGAVAAAVSGVKTHSPNLASIIRRINPAVKRVGGQASGDELLRLAIEANARQSADDVLKKSAILAELVHGGSLGVITGIYKLGTGEVVRL